MENSAFHSKEELIDLATEGGKEIEGSELPFLDAFTEMSLWAFSGRDGQGGAWSCVASSRTADARNRCASATLRR